MRKLLCIILIVILATSCATVKLPQPYSYSNYIDYSAFTEQGIFVTESNSVSFDYQQLGSISVVEVGGWVSVDKGKRTLTVRRNADYYQ